MSLVVSIYYDNFNHILSINQLMKILNAFINYFTLLSLFLHFLLHFNAFFGVLRPFIVYLKTQDYIPGGPVTVVYLRTRFLFG